MEHDNKIDSSKAMEYADTIMNENKDVLKMLATNTEAVTVDIKLLPHGFKLPEYKSDLASGVDLYAANDEPIAMNGIGVTKVIPIGISVAIPEGYEGQVRSRSGLASKNSIVVTNAPGTIDADYRGEISVILTNIGGKRFTIERGMRIAQLVFTPVVRVRFNETDELNKTDRGEKGFGSTGV